MRTDDVPRRVPNIVGRMVDEEAVLVHPGQGKVRVLNPVGARIWDLIDGQRTVADMARVVAQEYNVEPGTAEADALAFCTDLARRGLLAEDR